MHPTIYNCCGGSESEFRSPRTSESLHGHRSFAESPCYCVLSCRRDGIHYDDTIGAVVAAAAAAAATAGHSRAVSVMLIRYAVAGPVNHQFHIAAGHHANTIRIGRNAYSIQALKSLVAYSLLREINGKITRKH